MKRAILALFLMVAATFAEGPVTPPGIQVLGTPQDNNLLVYTNGVFVDSGVAPTNLVSVENLTDDIATNTANIAQNAADILTATPGNYSTVSNNAMSAYNTVQNYAVDPTTLQLMINTNAAAIDALASSEIDVSTLFGTEIFFIPTTSNAVVNGSNLWAAVNGFNGAGETNAVLTGTGGYTLPADLTVSGAVTHVMSLYSDSFSVSWNYSDHPPSQPANPPNAVIIGNISIDQTAKGSSFEGFKIEGNISAPTTDVTDSATPPVLRNCWVTGSIATNQKTALMLDNVFASGQVCGGGDAIWAGDIKDSILLEDGSLYTIGGWGKTDRGVSISDTWLAYEGHSLGGGISGSQFWMRNCKVQGDNKFHGMELGINAKVEYCLFYHDSPSHGSWAAVTDGVKSWFKFTEGVDTDITNHASTIVIYSTDFNGNPIP